MTQMVNGLMKLGLPQNASLENRRLSLDLAGLVVHWEQRRIADAEAAPTGVRTMRRPPAFPRQEIPQLQCLLPPVSIRSRCMLRFQ